MGFYFRSLGLREPRVTLFKPLSEFISGELTFFGGAPDGMDPSSPSYGTSEGACGYGSIPKDAFPYFSTMAFGLNNQFFKSLPLDSCGTCYQVQCQDPRPGACKTDSAGKPLSVIAMITDKCPECGDNHIDVQAQAFAKISKPELGRIKIAYRHVECAVPGDLKVSVKDFAGANGWIRLSVDDTGGRGAVKELYVKGSGQNEWRAMDNTWGAAWELSSAPAPPLAFKFVCDDGEEVIAEDVVTQNGGISGGLKSPVSFSTGKQFTITDPTVTTISAFDGASDPMLVTSDTPGNADGASAPVSSTTSSSSSSEGGCTDEAPDGKYTCQQQKDFGQCGADFMKDFCNLSCDRCSNSVSGGSRKLLGGRRRLTNLI
ncbi:putative expansin-A17 [Nannochloris sp. 'desiccata']|nr:putative expansin-A17 [Chlorella desiccata (nom. nud.)]